MNDFLITTRYKPCKGATERGARTLSLDSIIFYNVSFLLFASLSNEQAEQGQEDHQIGVHLDSERDREVERESCMVIIAID